MNYPLNTCWFCKRPLKSNGSPYTFSCPQDEYSVDFFSTFTMVEFTFRRAAYHRYDFKFQEDEFSKKMFVHIEEGKDKWSSYQLDCHLEVTDKNYLDVIERVKKLQAFK